MRPSQAFHVLETLKDIPSAPLRRKGVVLSDCDAQTVSEIYQQWLLLMIDLGYLHLGSLLRDARRLWDDFHKADVYSLNQACTECLQAIRLQTPGSFKGSCGEISRHLYNAVKIDFLGCLSGDVIAAKRLIQLFSYTGRMSLNDIDLTQQQLDAYLENESLIKEEFPENVTRVLNKIIRSWFGTSLPYEIVPRHGPGGIAELGKCSLEDKYNTLSTDELLEYAFGEPWWIFRDDVKFLRRSRTIFVPKSYKTFRTISMEPAVLQYFQQGVWWVIKKWVEASPEPSLIETKQWRRTRLYLRNHIGFEEQERNRMLAREGSLSRNYATIDLSAASDLVSYALVKKLFKGTWLLRYIVATRSRETLFPDGRIITIKKFAPMGSSLCFPIETIIFAAICEHVTRVHHATGRYSVYGDDIIVPTHCASIVMRFLGILGFQVNPDKSFYQDTCWFRESCGGEYCDGYDVTPMRVSRKYASRDDNVRYAKLIEKANEAYERGFRFLRYFYLWKLRCINQKFLFAPTSVLSDNYTNYHTRKKWNNRFQRIDVLCAQLITRYPVTDPHNESETIRYFHWLSSCYERTFVLDGFRAEIGRPMVRLKETWQMKPYELSDQQFIDSMLGRSE